ncbi:putative membrane protein [Helicobacter pylori Hp A-27]|nr:putative membrane protein [Helicobacter pylori Hp A-27]
MNFFISFFYYATGIFSSVILKLLFLKTGFYLLCFVISKLLLKFYLKLIF